MLLDNNIEKKRILVKDNDGWLPIHFACYGGATVEVIRLLLDSNVEKKTVHEKGDCLFPDCVLIFLVHPFIQVFRFLSTLTICMTYPYVGFLFVLAASETNDQL